MKIPIRFIASIMVLSMLTLVACAGRNETSGEVQSSSTMPPSSSMPSGTASSAVTSRTDMQRKVESREGATSVTPVEENPVTDGLTPDLEKELAAPDNTEQMIEACLLYLRESLTEEQHGGIYRTGDARGSGMLTHGGPDIEDYILIYAIDTGAVDNAIGSYMGRLPEIVVLNAKYSMTQLNVVKQELENSELAPIIDRFVFGAYTNTVTIMVSTLSYVHHQKT